jgi:hypothetical protein
MQDYQVCVNSALINNYLTQQDKKDQALEYVCDKIIYLFKDQLETCECQEDIHDDLSFETDYIIDRDSWDTTTEEVIKSIYSDFDIKVAK